LDERGNPRVAFKQLKGSGNELIERAKKEADGFELMRGLKCDHLIKAIAYYKQSGEHYFITPWAKYGDLWNFWMTTEKKPRTDKDYFIWAFGQLAGIARGIEKLHASAAKSGPNCRHGDLKPENILCFPDDEEDHNNGRYPSVRLVITDPGLAKIHNDATKLRSATKTTVSTERYLAPEMKTHPNGKLSRRFDIWSLGCIFLEFVIWLLYGAGELNNCTLEYKGAFFVFDEGKDTEADIHPTVARWVTHIKRDRRCGEGTAVRRLIDLIVGKLLVVKVGYLDVESSTEGPKASLAKQEAKEPVPGITKSEGTWLKDSSNEPGDRVHADVMRKELCAILKGLKDKTIRPITPLPEQEIPRGPHNGMLAVRPANRVR
jgi:serine/threonine protein kinase